MTSQALPAQRDSPAVKAIGYWWAGACVFQTAWTFAFAYEHLWLSTICLLLTTACLGFVYFKLHDKVCQFFVCCRS